MMEKICCDFHAHVLPNADHGSISISMSLSQLERAKECGINVIVATPHFYPQLHTIEKFCEIREKTYKDLVIQEMEDMPKILKGSEVQLCDGLDRIKGIEKLCIENTKNMLLEIPNSEFTNMMKETILRLYEQQGISAIIAHPERYPLETTFALEELNVPFQINAYGFATLFTRKRCMTWLKEKRVVALGSDIHKHGKEYGYYAKLRHRLGNDFDIIQKRMQDLIEL